MDKFSQVFGYVFAAASIYLAFLFLSKKQFRWSGACVTFAFVAFVLIQLFGNGVFGPHDISTEQIICWLFAAGFLSLAVYFAHKGSLPYAFAIVIMAAFAGFAGLSGVQSFLKTHILWQVTSTLKTYGEKIDQFQTSVLEMRKELTEQQKSLTINQQFLGLLVTNFQNEVKSKQIGFEEAVSKQGKELTVVQFGIQSAQSNVFGQQTEMEHQLISLKSLQSNLDLVEISIQDQQSKLTNVESLVNNLYSKTRIEDFVPNNTNKIIVVKQEGRVVVLLRLDFVPVENSIQAIASTQLGQFPLLAGLNQYDNLVKEYFASGTEINSIQVKYIKRNDINPPVKTIFWVSTNKISIGGSEVYAEHL